MLYDGGLTGIVMNYFLISLFKKLRLHNMLNNTIILMDNCKAHKNKIALKMMTKIQFLFNAPYSPEFNPIEYIFNSLKFEVRRKIVTE